MSTQGIGVIFPNTGGNGAATTSATAGLVAVPPVRGPAAAGRFPLSPNCCGKVLYRQKSYEIMTIMTIIVHLRSNFYKILKAKQPMYRNEPSSAPGSHSGGEEGEGAETKS